MLNNRLNPRVVIYLSVSAKKSLKKKKILNWWAEDWEINDKSQLWVPQLAIITVGYIYLLNISPNYLQVLISFGFLVPRMCSGILEVVYDSFK